MSIGYFFLFLGIVLEIVGLAALKESYGFTRWFPTLVFAVGIGASFYFESLALRTLPISMTYAVWAAAGVIGMAAVGALFYGESVGIGSAIGVLLVVSGVTVMLYSTSAAVQSAS